MEQNISSPIFIGGLMKSGTSLLRKLISLHPNVFGGLETFWFSGDFVNYWQDGNSKRQQWLAEFFEISALEMEAIRKEAIDAYDFLNRFMDYCAKKEGKSRWVEKTPDNVFYLETIWSHWEGAKVLIMQRDLRDVYASWKKNKKRSLENFLEIAAQYQIEVTKYRADDRLLLISYKDLVMDTRGVLKKVFPFIGENYLEGLENYEGDESDYNKVLKVTGKISATTESLKKPIFTNSLNQWKEILNTEEAEKIQATQIIY